MVEPGLIVTVRLGAGLPDRAAAAGRRMSGPSPLGARAFRVIDRARDGPGGKSFRYERADGARHRANDDDLIVRE
jgi:hypothetical protein